MRLHATTRLSIAIFAACWFSAVASATNFNRLVVFGDSLSDVGNTSIATFGFVPGGGYFDGRFSNGQVWVEQLAALMALPAPTESLLGGSNYAYGGAETGPGNTSLIIPNTNNQLSAFFDDGGLQVGDLAVVFAGANNFFNGESNPQNVIDDLVGNITALANAGARDFLVFNYLPLGQVPDELGTPNEPVLDALIDTFNADYFAALDAVEPTLNATFYRVDLHTTFGEILVNPAAFGFTNITDQGINAADASTYLFWDGVHPTVAGHTLIAEFVFDILENARLNPGDANGDGVIDVDDLVAVILAWGPCPGKGECPADFDQNGQVDVDDLVAVILNWNSS